MFRLFDTTPTRVDARFGSESKQDFPNPVNYSYKFNLTPALEAKGEEHFRFVKEYIEETIKGKKLVELLYYPQHDFRAKFQKTFQRISARNNCYADVRLLWHGTPVENNDSIMSNNYDMSFVGKTMGAKGSYGAGIYFSEDGYYCPEDNILLNYVITGKQFNCGTLRRKSDNLPLYYGCPLQDGYDSHIGTINPSAEIVVFDNTQILPTYVCKVRNR